MFNRRQFLGASAALLTAGRTAFAQTAFGPAAPAPTAADWAKVVDAAKKEGQLVVYTGAQGPEQHAVANAFTAKYGIKVDLLEGRPTDLRERTRTEQTTGRYIADLSLHGETTSKTMVGDGLFQPFGGLPSIARLRSPLVATAYNLPIFVIAYVILVNTDQVKPADEPKGWVDLTDPKWKGKILSDDARVAGGGGVYFTVLYDKLGRPFHEKLAAQTLQFSRNLGDNEQRVARGEYAIYIPMSVQDLHSLEGLPVKAINPVEGSPYIAFDLAMHKNAPHANAARLFMEYALSNEAQAIQNGTGTIPVVEGVAPANMAPNVAALMPQIKLLGTTDASRQDQMLALAKEIYH